MATDSLDTGSLMRLERLKMSELMERARAVGAPNDVIDECMDQSNVRKDPLHSPLLETSAAHALNVECPFPHTAPGSTHCDAGGGGKRSGFRRRSISLQPAVRHGTDTCWGAPAASALP